MMDTGGFFGFWINQGNFGSIEWHIDVKDGSFWSCLSWFLVFLVDVDAFDNDFVELRINLLDNTAEGVECVRDKIFSVQYHPESAPGPQDSSYLFDKFISMMEKEKNHNA